MRSSTLWCVVLVLIAGNLIGVLIGEVPILLQGYFYATDCNWIGDHEDNCKWADNRVCSWNATSTSDGVARCHFTAFIKTNTSCLDIDNRGECQAHSESCIWTRPPGAAELKCRYQQGWSESDMALVATMSTIGGILGAMLAGIAVARMGVNNSIALSGVASILAGALLIVGWQSRDDQTRLVIICIGRFLCGVYMGMASALIPLYIGDVGPRERAGVLGVGLQVSITFGIMTAAMMGFAANPSKRDLHPRKGVEILEYYYLVLSVLLVPAALIAEKPLFDDETRNSLLSFRNSAFLRIQPGGGVGGGTGGAGGGGGGGTGAIGNAHADPVAASYGAAGVVGGTAAPAGGGGALEKQSSLFKRPLYVAIAVLLAAAQQLCGINAVINYVTVIATYLGIENPYLAGFVVMVWNFVTSILAIWVASRVTAGRMFVIGQFLVALSCFMCAIPIRFFNPHDTVPAAFIFAGFGFFILFFECSLGSVFYPLAQSVFPPEIRSSGCSFVMMCQFIFNTLTTFLFPILVKEFSGGASKPQDKGIGIVFFIFGALGIALTISVRRVMGRIQEETAEYQGDECHGVVETVDNVTSY